MRTFEVFLRSGARVEITAEVLQDDDNQAHKIYFYRDKRLNHLAAYFNREDVAGITFGQEISSSLQNRFTQ